jgi:hypothetical protein
MSRHMISSSSPRFEIIVGWDRPLNSYFAQVRDLKAVDEDDALVVWVGASFSEIETPEALQPHISRYAIIPREILAVLRADRAATLDKGDSDLQRDMRIILERSETE